MQKSIGTTPQSPATASLHASVHAGWFVLFALTLGLIFNLLGYLPEHVRLLLICVGLLPPVLIARPGLRGWAVLGAAVLANALVRHNPVFEICVLLIAHYAAWSGARGRWKACYPAVVFFALLFVFLFLSPQGYFPLEGLARGVTRLYARLMRGPCNLGYTYQNIGSVLLFVTLSMFLIRNGLSFLRSLCFAVLLLLVTVAAITFVLFRADLNAELLLKLRFREYFGYRAYLAFLRQLIAVGFPGLLFLAHLALFALFHWPDLVLQAAPGAGVRLPAAGGEGMDPANEPLVTRWPGIARAARRLCVPLALLFVIILTPLSCAVRAAPRKALFYSRGVVSFSKPVYSGYGLASAGMFGTFVDFVNLFGYQAAVTDEIPERLDDVDLVVLTNLDREMPAETARRIWRYVSEGGSLWVLGDHTFIKNGRHHINDFLKPCAIRLNNDSAKNMIQGWFEAYELRLAQPFVSLPNDAENSLSILVGASLRIEPPATPLIIGRYGFSDLAPPVPDEKGGNMGDYRFTRKERLGDMVFVAAQPYGKGRLVVFGDTSSFFNGSTAKTHALIRAVLTHFRMRQPSGALLRATRWAPYLLLPFLALCLVWTAPSRHMPAVLGTLLVWSLLWQHQARLIPFDRAAARERLALIDVSHNPAISKHALMADAVLGVAVNVMRYGWLPVTPDTWDPALLDNARCLFLIAPRKPFGRSEVADVLKFMERGGTVIMACGRRQAPAARALLARLEFDVLNIPLGRFFDRTAFGHPVSFFSAWALAATAEDVEVITAYDAWPVIAARPWQKGRFILIGDAEFLLNKNLEGDGKHDINNIEFLRRLFDYATGKKNP